MESKAGWCQGSYPSFVVVMCALVYFQGSEDLEYFEFIAFNNYLFLRKFDIFMMFSFHIKFKWISVSVGTPHPPSSCFIHTSTAIAIEQRIVPSCV